MDTGNLYLLDPKKIKMFSQFKDLVLDYKILKFHHLKDSIKTKEQIIFSKLDLIRLKNLVN